MRNESTRPWLIAVAAMTLACGYSWESPSAAGQTSGGSKNVRANAPAETKATPQPEAARETEQFKESEESEEAQEVEEIEITDESGAAESEAADGARLQIFVNDAKNQRVYRGWPLFVKAVIENPADSAELVTVEKGEGWDEAIEIEIRDEKNRLHAWPLRPAPAMRVDDSIELAAGEAATIVFIASGAEMKPVKPGEYRLSAAYGDLRIARDVVVHVEDHPDELDEADERYREKLNALYVLMTGRGAAGRTPQPQPPAPVYVMQASPSGEPSGASGAEALGSLLSLASEFGLDPGAYAAESDYSDDSYDY